MADPLTIAGGMAIAGTLMQFKGQKDAAKAAKRMGARENEARQKEAIQLEFQAGQSIAASQRKMLEERRQAQLVQSRAQAVAAASGGGSSDPTVVGIISKIAGEGAYRESVALFDGYDRARLLRESAKAKRLEGEIAAEGGNYRAKAYETMATASLLKGGASIGESLYSRYGKGGPKGDEGLLDAGISDSDIA